MKFNKQHLSVCLRAVKNNNKQFKSKLKKKNAIVQGKYWYIVQKTETIEQKTENNKEYKNKYKYIESNNNCVWVKVSADN